MAFLRDLAYDYPSQPGKLFAILLKGFFRTGVCLLVTTDGIIFVFELYC